MKQSRYKYWSILNPRLQDPPSARNSGLTLITRSLASLLLLSIFLSAIPRLVSMMDQSSQSAFGMQGSSDHSRLFSGHPKTPETFERRCPDHFDGYSHCQKAMTPYVVRTPPGLVRYSLPLLPETPCPTYSMPTTPHWIAPTPVFSLPHPPVPSSPSDGSFPSALPTHPTPPAIYSGVGNDSRFYQFPIGDSEFPLMPLRMDANFWASVSNCTGETQIFGMAQVPQLEFEYEEYTDESSGTPEIRASYISEDDGYYASCEDSSCVENYMDESSEDDGYYASGEDSSSIGDFDEVHTPLESQGSPAALATSGDYSLSDPESPPQLGFIRKPLTSQGREYEQWLESQDEPSGRSDSPEIHSPIPRHLVQWRSFPL